MGAPRGAPEALLLAAVMHRPESNPGKPRRMASVFGRVTDRSPTFSFEESDYYRGEMGDGLRKFIAVSTARSPRETWPGSSWTPMGSSNGRASTAAGVSTSTRGS